MDKFLIFILIPFFCSCQVKESKCNPNIHHIYQEYNYASLDKDFIKKDIEFAKKIKNVLESNSKVDIMKIIPINETDKKFKLVNGFISISRSYGIGYFSVFYDYIINNDSLLSYQLGISKKEFFYIKKYGVDLSALFIYNKEKDIYNYIYNFDKVSRPYKEVRGYEDINENIKFYMSPYSGTRYGCRGGYGNTIIDNRCAFNQIENNLTTQDIFDILYSINPASRLTAIEYYYKNTSYFNKEEQKKIGVVIENIFNELVDEIEYLEGDLVLYDKPRGVIEKILKAGCN